MTQLNKTKDTYTYRYGLYTNSTLTYCTTKLCNINNIPSKKREGLADVDSGCLSPQWLEI